VREAFRALGHNAWSNDIEPADDGSEFHIEGDCFDAIVREGGVLPLPSHWDLIILHPPCTALANSGNHRYAKSGVCHQERLDAIEWTLQLWEHAKAHAPRVVLENPPGAIPMKAKQFIQPYQYGHGEKKRTGLWLHGLWSLQFTDLVDGREEVMYNLPPNKHRAKKRSRTYEGIAKAMADQFGSGRRDRLPEGG